MTPMRSLVLGVGILLAAAAPRAIEPAERLVGVGQAAPEITGGPWHNSRPLSLAGLRGRVVLVEFWTYG
jgi:hypothetical protein